MRISERVARDRYPGTELVAQTGHRPLEGIGEVGQIRPLHEEDRLPGQGHLFSLPLDREELALYLAKGRQSVGTCPTGSTPR
jgi:hypothetical protein